MKTKRLTRRQFARAIRYGQGRAFLHVKEYGDQGTEDEILHACTNDLVYDMQYENCRARWLARILDHTGRIEEYVEPILAALKQSPEDSNSYVQMAALAGELFERGFSDCKDVLFGLPSVVHNRDERLDVCGALVKVGSLNGFEKSIQMMPEADDWVMHSLYQRTIAELDDEWGVDSFLERTRGGDTAIEKFCQAIQRKKDSQLQKDKTKSDSGTKRIEYTLTDVLNLTEADTNFGRITQRIALRRFGKAASETDLARILDRLEQEENAVCQRAFLAVFEDRELPKITKRVLDLLRSGDTEVRAAASEALSLTKSPRVHGAALEFLYKGTEEDTVIALTLFKRNYRSTDQSALLTALKQLKTADGLHSAGLDLLNLADHCRSVKGIRDLLVWICENTPCGGCRESALRGLVELQATDEPVMYEAQWDAHDRAGTTARAVWQSIIQA